MLRLLKALPLTLALVVLIFFSASCGSGNNTQIRVFNAIPNAQAPLDVDLNGNKIITALPFQSISPSTNPPATYTSVPSGTDTITAFVTGTTTPPVNNGTTSFSSSTQYTVVLQGSVASNSPPAVLTDNNTAPTSGTLEYRIINASPSAPGGSVDVYIFQTGNQLPSQPQISGLTLGQGIYIPSLPFSSSTGYTVVVTPHQQTIPFVNQNYTPATGSITTLVLVDVANGGSLSPIPISLTDVN